MYFMGHAILVAIHLLSNGGDIGDIPRLLYSTRTPSKARRTYVENTRLTWGGAFELHMSLILKIINPGSIS